MSDDKENRRPLHQRLSLSIQRQSLQPRSTSDTVITKQQPSTQKRTADEFERRLAEAVSYTGASPLSVWYSLYEWTCAHAVAQLQRLLETALELLQSDPAYPSSSQYVGLWLAYARLCPDPLPFYTDMYTQGVGSSLTSLYAHWADALEGGGREDEADAVYMKGLLMQANPLTELIARYGAFKKRLAEKGRQQQRQPQPLSAAADVGRKRSTTTAAEPPREAKQLKQMQAQPSVSEAAAAAVDRDVPGYDERLLTLDGEESQFEEHRIRHWFRTHPRPALPSQQPQQPATSSRPLAQRRALEPVHVTRPSPSSSSAVAMPAPPSAATTPSSSRTREDLASFLQLSTSTLPNPVPSRSQPSPTVHTRAAMDDVDAMFRDTTATSLLPSRPSSSSSSSAFNATSLTAELLPLPPTTPHLPLTDAKSRPSPLAFNIHEDTELIRPPASTPSISSTPSMFQVYEDTALIAASARRAVGQDEEEEEEELEVALQTDETITARLAGGGTTPTSAASTYRGASLVGLTPIMETSRESDASSLSNVSMRSTSSLSSQTASFHPTSTTRHPAHPHPTPSHPSPSPRTHSHPAHPTNTASGDGSAINPLASSIQQLILADLNVGGSDGVTVEGGRAPEEVQGMARGEVGGVVGGDVDVGSWWLRVEGGREGEGVEEGEGQERRKTVVMHVTDMSSNTLHALHLHQPSSLWAHHMSSVIRARLPAAAQAALQLVTATHAYEELSASLVPMPSHGTLTLAALLTAYQRRGQTLPSLLAAFYLHSLLNSLLALASAQVLHCALSPAVCHVASDVLVTDDWQAELPSPWPMQGLSLSMWTSALDLAVWEGEEGEWRAADEKGAARVLWAMVGGEEASVEEVGMGRLKGTRGGKVGGLDGAGVVRRLWGAGGGAGGVKVLMELRRELEVWMMGEGARTRQVKRLLCEQSVMLSSS